jgi:hypothetical protein
LEVVAAIQTLKKNKVAGAERIGLWGISRAGWIAPLVIQAYGDIDFWISVSGVDDHETFKYLLGQNLRINGHPEDSVALLLKEWHNGLLISRGGASYEYYMKATSNLQENRFWLEMTNGGITKEGYYEYQKILDKVELDRESDLPLYVANFKGILSAIEIPVLALFGETDMTVDWQKTKLLYERTLGVNTDLTIQTFPSCNHNMWQSSTGGLLEFRDGNKAYIRCDGYMDSITNWLHQLER